MTTNKYLRRSKKEPSLDQKGRYERYNLRENPFPSSPFVNPLSNDARSNGDIYEPTIRAQEYENIKSGFLVVPKDDPNHLRLGYIIDTSYIGRGNGKSAFLLNLQRTINSDFGAGVSNEVNKCFSITLVPEPGGKTKTFERFVDLFAQGIFGSGIIDDCLITLRLEALIAMDEAFDLSSHFSDEDDLREKLSTEKWFSLNNFSSYHVNDQILQNPYLNDLPDRFPLVDRGIVSSSIANNRNFERYYDELKRGKPKLEFVFSHLISVFLAAGFNGAYIFVDDYERIPDFQSERQKRDFALELRTCLFDGLFVNARIGFYTFLLVLHAGVPRLIQNAWDQSGLEQRAPIFYSGNPKHVIRFEKINLDDAFSLVQKYLQEYRIETTDNNEMYPFKADAIRKMAEISEFNASRILKMAYEVLESAVDKDIEMIDAEFILLDSDGSIIEEPKRATGIKDTPTKDLLRDDG